MQTQTGGYTRILSNGETAYYNEEGINLDDIPEVTDFSKWKKRPPRTAPKTAYTIVIEYDGYNEIRRYDYNVIPRPARGKDIPVEVTIEKRI